MTNPLGLDLAVSRKQVAIEVAGGAALLLDPDGAEYRVAGNVWGTLPERAFHWNEVRKIDRCIGPRDKDTGSLLRAVRFSFLDRSRSVVVPVAATVDVDEVVAYCTALASRPGPPLWQVRIKAAAESTNSGPERLCKIHPYASLVAILVLVYFTVQMVNFGDWGDWQMAVRIGWVATGLWVIAQSVQLRSALRKLGDRRPFGAPE
ncbi:hypothetical protein [Pseudonocardia spinosispora]|uniref:hypothetical protein n=1 Tax=Pseudonocardia spinosispora TaxID=103441 RepID=UPI0012EBF910|nr:hypothetical protein [Pseudonocardia spinosispora]